MQWRNPCSPYYSSSLKSLLKNNCNNWGSQYHTTWDRLMLTKWAVPSCKEEPGILTEILPGVLPGVLYGVLPGVLYGVLPCVLYGILYEVLYGVLYGVLPGVLYIWGTTWCIIWGTIWDRLMLTYWAVASCKGEPGLLPGVLYGVLPGLLPEILPGIGWCWPSELLPAARGNVAGCE